MSDQGAGNECQQESSLPSVRSSHLRVNNEQEQCWQQKPVHCSKSTSFLNTFQLSIGCSSYSLYVYLNLVRFQLTCILNATFCVWKQNICREYAAEYLAAGEQTVTLVMAERSKSWEVEVHPRNGGAKVLRGGWHKFARYYHLKVQDICLFQLITDQRKLTMMVDIIRHNEKR